eukprot:CAMPEP_0181433114 /NCGR_PEP_ID=MMETSP1110-20121109/19121_1 /TAXON_ID=174948 /ORGANISM="Symbiodinium sp., Strain CCMP421" /LENGTH=131 /DNA_ID=CAMNT_0023556549 /DNA_START=61 /DNA_END=454 /DNA_ORIENTATION=-
MGENKLFVGSLPPDITKEEIEIVFKTYGDVTDVHVIAGDRNRSATGQACAFVTYGGREGAETAIQVLNGVYKIREDAPNAIQVNWADQPKAKAQAQVGMARATAAASVAAVDVTAAGMGAAAEAAAAVAAA